MLSQTYVLRLPRNINTFVTVREPVTFFMLLGGRIQVTCSMHSFRHKY